MTHVLDALGRIKEYWGSVALADLDDYARGRIIRGGVADWEAYAAETLGAVLIGTGADIFSTITPTFVGLTTHDAGIAVGTGQDVDPADASGQNLGDATHRWDLYAQTVFFGGASNSNVISLLTGQAVGFKIVDDAGPPVEYFRIDTNPQLAVHINPGVVDIDTYISGSTPNAAIFVQGSDSTITLGGPSMTTPSAWWVGVGVALERIVFDGAGGDISVMGARFGVETLTPGSVLGVPLPGSVMQVASGASHAWHCIVGALTASFNMVDTGAALNVKWIQHICDAGAYSLHALTDVGGISIGNLMTMNLATGDAGMGVLPGSIAAQLHVDQSSASGAQPVLLLDQADLSEEFIEFTTTVGAGNPIDTAAHGAYYGKVRVMVTGVGYKVLALYEES